MAGRGRVSKRNILKNIEDMEMENDGPIAKARQKVLDSIFPRSELGCGSIRNSLKNVKDMENDGPIAKARQKVLDSIRFELGRGSIRNSLKNVKDMENDGPVVTTRQVQKQEVLDSAIITKIVLGRGRARGRGFGRGRSLTSPFEDLPGLELKNLNQSNDVNTPVEGQFNNCEPEEGRGRGGWGAKQIPTPAPAPTPSSHTNPNEWDGDEW